MGSEEQVVLDNSSKEVVHPNEMVRWANIACQRGHGSHETKLISVDLSSPHSYFDYPQIPERFHVSWDMLVWDPCVLGDGPYCPANDAVSQTIQSIGIWEPRETILASQVFSTGPGAFLDLGAQLGWFSHLARSCGVLAYPYDADPECVRILLDQAFPAIETRFGPDMAEVFPDTYRLVKLDLEGAEQHAIHSLWPALESGCVDHILMEVSPCFNNSYETLVSSIVDLGYTAYLLPPKKTPPYPLDDIERDLAPFQVDRDAAVSLIPTLHQEDMWFRRDDATW